MRAERGTQTTQRRLLIRPGSIKRNGSLVSASMISAWSPHADALHAMDQRIPVHTLRRDRTAMALPPRREPFNDPRPPAQSLWAATVSGARRRLKPPLTPLASPRLVEAPFPRAR